MNMLSIDKETHKYIHMGIDSDEGSVSFSAIYVGDDYYVRKTDSGVEYYKYQDDSWNLPIRMSKEQIPDEILEEVAKELI